jgi:glyoxylase-like metal-dependent hydrolase (beta-lactamase superfamily II)
MSDTAVIRHPDGIAAVDARYVRPGMAAVHVVVDHGRAAIVDTGTHHSVPYVLRALAELGVAHSAVDAVILTHVHLDHAGGAGSLMRELPSATLLVHPRGAQHMIDPAKLIAGSKAVYGGEMYSQLYGELVPVPAGRVRAMEDGESWTLGKRTLNFLHTPGHALHHQSIHDTLANVVFTGDTFGLSYRELDTARGPFVVATTTPTQFDPQQLVASIHRIVALGPRAVCMTHFSRVEQVPRLAADLERQVHDFVDIARRNVSAPDPMTAMRDGIWSLWLRLLREHGCTLSETDIGHVLGDDLTLNAQGLVAWLERLARDQS